MTKSNEANIGEAKSIESGDKPLFAFPFELPPGVISNDVMNLSNEASRLLILESLEKQVEINGGNFSSLVAKQGPFGRLIDLSKNSLGSHSDFPDPSRSRALWSAIIDYDSGSQSTFNRIEIERQLVKFLRHSHENNDVEEFQTHLKQLLAGNLRRLGRAQNATVTFGSHIVGTLKSTEMIQRYDSSQKGAVDMTTDVLGFVGTSVLVGLGHKAKLVNAKNAVYAMTLVNGSSKAGLMQLDDNYAKLGRDFGMGAVWGGAAHFGSKLSLGFGERYLASKYGQGLQMEKTALNPYIVLPDTSRLSQRLSIAALNSGASWGAFGLAEAPGRAAVEGLSGGRVLSAQEVAFNTTHGASKWFLIGTAVDMGAGTQKSVLKRILVTGILGSAR